MSMDDAILLRCNRCTWGVDQVGGAGLPPAAQLRPVWRSNCSRVPEVLGGSCLYASEDYTYGPSRRMAVTSAI